MVKKLKEHAVVIGLFFTVAMAVSSLVISWQFFDNPALQPFWYDLGIDVLGSLICAALYYGFMRQAGEGISAFRSLNILTSLGFIVNELMCYTALQPERRTIFFALCIVCKLIDLVMIYFFYHYVKETLGFEGKLVTLADKGIPIFMGIESLVILSNIFYPVTFMVDADGMYYATAFSWAEDIYLALASLVTAVLIFKCESPRNQKIAAMTFIVLPLINYALLGGEFGSASQYGIVLMSLIIMYCIIFNDKSSKLAATQTELDMATRIQASMLPSIFPAFPTRDEFDLYAKMDPAKEVGGDFYDFFMIDDDHLGVVIADVSGKGIPAALFMMISKTIVQNYATLGISPAEVLNRANESLCAQNKMDMFVTVWVGILELSTGKMVCSSAGHEYPMIYHDGKFEMFKDKHGLVLGIMDIARYKDYELQLEKGDKIFVYTDGVPEATNANGKLFGFDRTVEALNVKPEANPKEILKIVREQVDAFVGEAEQFDDVTMVCVEYRGV